MAGMDGSEEESNIRPPLHSESWCRTQMTDDICHTFNWTIERFSERPEANGQVMLSSEFTIKDHDDNVTKWKLELYPKGSKPEDSGHLAIFLFSRNDREVQAKFVFAVLDANMNKHPNCSTRKSHLKPFKPNMTSWGFRQFISWDTLKSNTQLLLPNDCLTIVCNVTIVGQEKILSGYKVGEDLSKIGHCRKRVKGVRQLSHDLKKLYQEGDFSDVQIECHGKTFNCHQNILGARSPVFKAMFVNNTAEKQSRVVKIEDFEPNIVEDMINFIYTGTISDLEKNAEDLLKAAEKYIIDDLKDMCEDRLCEVLQVEDAVNYLILGDVFQALTLKKMSLQFIVRNLSHVIQTKEWKERLISHPALMAELMEDLARRGDQPAAEPAHKKKKVSTVTLDSEKKDLKSKKS